MKALNTFALIASVAIFANLFAGCGPLLGIHGSGHSAAQTRQLAAFDALDNNSVVSVYLRVGQADDAVLVCDDNLLEYIDTSVELGKLVIRDRDGLEHVDLHPRTECSLEVSTQQLNRVVLNSSGSVNLEGPLAELYTMDLNGSGSFTATGVDGSKLKIMHDGSGSATVRGEVQELEIKKNGSGQLSAKGLHARDVHMIHNSSGSAGVYASDSIYLRNNGSGHVSIAGDPADRDVRDIGSGYIHFE